MGVRRSLAATQKAVSSSPLSLAAFLNVSKAISQPHPLTHVTNFPRDLKSASDFILFYFSHLSDSSFLEQRVVRKREKEFPRIYHFFLLELGKSL